jgi:mono/diheme cytochrome c family protein
MLWECQLPSATRCSTRSRPRSARRPTGTKLLEFDLASDWAADASAGAKALSGLPRTVAAVAGGTLGYFRIFASDGSTCHMQGTSIATGGGDLTVMPTSSTRRTSPSPTHRYRAGA